MEMEEFNKRLTEVECQSKTNSDNLKILEGKVDDLHKIATSVELIAKDMSYIKTDISEMKDSQKDLQKGQQDLQNKIADVEGSSAKKKEKFIDDIISKIVWLVIGGIVTGILVYLLPQFFK